MSFYHFKKWQDLSTAAIAQFDESSIELQRTSERVKEEMSKARDEHDDSGAKSYYAKAQLLPPGTKPKGTRENWTNLDKELDKIIFKGCKDFKRHIEEKRDENSAPYSDDQQKVVDWLDHEIDLGEKQAEREKKSKRSLDESQDKIMSEHEMSKSKRNSVKSEKSMDDSQDKMKNMLGGGSDPSDSPSDSKTDGPSDDGPPNGSDPSPKGKNEISNNQSPNEKSDHPESNTLNKPEQNKTEEQKPSSNSQQEISQQESEERMKQYRERLNAQKEKGKNKDRDYDR